MNLGDGLIAAGFEGAHIAIVSENCCRYVISDITISSGVGVVTPIDVNAPVQLTATLLNKCDANAVLCGIEQVDKIKEIQKDCPLLQEIITINGKIEGITSYEELVELGKKHAKESTYRTMKLDLDAPAKILFTSGTTGANKGVVLTNANLAANMLNGMDAIQTRSKKNTSMSVLPMHHATEINTHIMVRIGVGRRTFICSSMRTMMRDIKIFKPDVVTIVPMIANAFYKNIMNGVRKAGKEEKLNKSIKNTKTLLPLKAEGLVFFVFMLLFLWYIFQCFY